MIIASLILVACAFVLAPLHLWQGALLLPLAGAIVGGAFGAWRFVCLWIAVFLILSLAQSFPWVELIVLLIAVGLTASVITRILDRDHGVIMIATLGFVFLVAVWLQSAIHLQRLYHPSMLGSFLLTLPFIIGMILWFTYPKRWIL